nr:protein-ADP-ribose hydrolase [uncultured Agathobaculum sp.]
MNQIDKIRSLNHMLLDEMPGYRAQAQAFPADESSQRRLLRSLMNVRPPMPLRPDFLAVQDELLRAERVRQGVVEVDALPVIDAHPRIALWQGDITRLRADAIVNAANAALLGCFHPCHSCIDNAIHSAAGLQLRQACHALMERQGHPEPNGQAKITPGYNLPARYVLHTVGPVVSGRVTARDRTELASCYRACLACAAEHELESVAFCCISTGEFHFPNEAAAEIAVRTVTDFLQQHVSIKKVVFNVFKDIDATIYRKLLGPDRTP